MFTQRAVGCIKKHRGSLFWGCLWFFACLQGETVVFVRRRREKYAVAYYAYLPVKLWYSHHSRAYYAHGKVIPVDLHGPDVSIFSSAAVRETEFFSIPRGFLRSAIIHTFT